MAQAPRGGEGSLMSAAREVLARAFEVPVADVPADASIENFRPWDSLGHLKVIAVIEEKLGRGLETDEVLAVIDLASIDRIVGGNAT